MGSVKDKINLIQTLTPGRAKVSEIPLLAINLVMHGILHTLEEPARVNKIEDPNSKNHHNAVKADEEPFCSNKVSVPALEELDSTVDTPYVNTDNRENYGAEKGHNRAL